MRDLATLLNRFSACRVLVLGDVMLDEYLTGDCSRLSPEAPVPVVTVTSSREALGGAANTAANVAALGGGVTLCGLLGRDDTGARLADAVRAAGIEFAPVYGPRPTVRKVRVVGQHQQLLRLDYEGLPERSPTPAADVLSAIAEQVDRCDVIVISDYAKGFLGHDLCQQVIALGRQRQRPVIVDPRPQHGAFYVGCDYMTPNWKESLGLLGRADAGASAADAAEVGQQLAARYGCNVLLTLGSRGMQLYGRDGALVCAERALAREVFDVSGAGDTVAATFALGLAAGCEARDAVALANQAAGIVVGKLGTATASPRELLRGEGQAELVARDELVALVARLRGEGKRLVTVNGSFDVLHAGHLHILHEAKRQGDVLIVGLNSDRSVRHYKDGARPYVGEHERAQMLLALKVVDFVHIFDEPVPMPFLEAVRPDVHVNGSEYGTECVEAGTVRAQGGRLHLVDRVPGWSTTGLVERIRRGSAPA